MGANHTINYKTDTDPVKTIKEKTGGRGVDVVIDSVGAATWETNISIVTKGGRIVLCGVTGGSSAKTNLQALYWNQLTILGSTMGSNEDFRQMLKAVSTAKLRPVIDSVMSLEDAAQAMGKMEKGQQFGKIVLRISQ